MLGDLETIGGIMRRSGPKDLFIIHSKEDDLDRNTVDALAALLMPVGFTMWGYSDWDWYVEQEKEPTWQDELLSRGHLFDFTGSMEEPRPRRRDQVDLRELDSLVSDSRVILFLRPLAERLSEGMGEEYHSLKRRPWRGNSEEPPPILFWCNYDGDERPPYPVDSHPWDFKWTLKTNGEVVCEESLKIVAVSVAVFLIQQRAKYVAKLKADKVENNYTLWCSPKSEISRGRKLLELLVDESGAVPPAIAPHARNLEGLLGAYSESDLDTNFIRRR
jgi:hypothetical protein